MLVLSAALIFLAVMLGLMYVDHRRDAKTKHAH
jgi:hypothetical protein